MTWQRWIRPGLIVTLIAAAVAVFMQRESVEHDLASRAAAALAANGQTWAGVAVNGRDVILSGTAPAPEARTLAVDVAAAVPGVRAVADATRLLPVASPYVWTARRSGGQVVLGGSIPSDGARAAVLAAARRAVPQAEIVDAMMPARGAPAAFGAAAAFALARLANLADGQVTVSDSTLAVAGTAADADAFAAIRDALASGLPPALSLGPVEILPARAGRFVWSANIDDTSVTLAGSVPNEAVRDSLAATARATIPGHTIVDALSVASGEPSGFAEAATFAVATLKLLARGGVTLDGAMLDIAGVARSVEDYDELLARLGSSLPGGINEVSTDITPASVATYGWQGMIGDGTVTLTGYVPSLERRSELSELARATFAGLKVDDRVHVALGEPRMDWVGAVKFAMGELALLKQGSVAIAETGFSIAGEARDPAAFQAIADIGGKTLPAGLVLKASTVTPPTLSPYRFSVERRDGGVALGGYVAKAEDRQALVVAARRLAGSSSVTDELVFASGAPAGFMTAANVAVSTLGRLIGGRVALSDQTVEFAGTAISEAALEETIEALRAGLPGSYSIVDLELTVAQIAQPVAPAECRDLLQAVLKAGRIEFDGSGAVITTDSLGVLDRVAGVFERCPETEIEVGAHSDSDGTAASNRDRTQARAEAIVEHLATAGVMRERLTAVGYGESKPVADNSTSAGKAANRRIEFSVTAPSG